MAAVLEQAADAIVTHLDAQTQGAGQTLNQTIIAAKKSFVSYTLEDLKQDTTARVAVVPMDMDVAESEGNKRAGTRARVLWQYHIDIGIHRAVANDAEFFEAMELYQQVNDLFSIARLPGLTSLYWKTSKAIAIAETNSYREQGVFMAVQRLIFRGQR